MTARATKKAVTNDALKFAAFAPRSFEVTCRMPENDPLGEFESCEVSVCNLAFSGPWARRAMGRHAMSRAGPARHDGITHLVMSPLWTVRTAGRCGWAGPGCSSARSRSTSWRHLP